MKVFLSLSLLFIPASLMAFQLPNKMLRYERGPKPLEMLRWLLGWRSILSLEWGCPMPIEMQTLL